MGKTNHTKILYRDEYLIRISKDKKLIHLGFVDHIPLIDKKIKKGDWLHKKLIDVCSICYGVDINKEGVEYIQNKYKYDNLHAVDIISENIPKKLLEEKFDYILIPDVIEHIRNPVYFLSSIRERFKNNVDKIVLTTPNAFRWDNFMNSFKNVEIINTDHRFWFTPFTLSKIVIDAGYTINKLGYFEHGKIGKRRILKKFILNKYIIFRDTLIMEARFNR